MDVDVENEEFVNLYVDLGVGECDFVGVCDLGGDVFVGFDGGCDKFFEEGCFNLRISWYFFNGRGCVFILIF